MDVLYLQVRCHPESPLSRFLRLQRPLIDTETICRSVLQRARNSLQIHVCMARTQLRVLEEYLAETEYDAVAKPLPHHLQP